MAFYINTACPGASREISRLLKESILRHPAGWEELVFLCIGSDRVTGDCLGPYTGHLLSRTKTPGIFVYGTLEQPVHALNLSQTCLQIQSDHPSALVIAIDAALGIKKHLGFVTIGNGPLYPGAGVQKELPPVGDIHITGIVNQSGHLEQMTLQSTHLSTVIFLGDIIAQGISGVIPSEKPIQKLLPVYKFLHRQVHISQEELLPGLTRQIHR